LQNVLAKMVIERVPSVEMVRFVSSGTEACLSVLRLMRAYTKREKVSNCLFTSFVQAQLLHYYIPAMPAQRSPCMVRQPDARD
jgi:hypothetical protein